jgi:hypothetical protein
MSDGGMGMVMVMMISMSMVLVCCCSGVFGAAGYANECDPNGSLKFLVGDWYNLNLFSGMCKESSGGGDGGGGDETTVVQKVDVPSGKTCNPGTIKNYEYVDRVLDEGTGYWKCPENYTDTYCGIKGEDGVNNARQCRKRRPDDEITDKKVTLFDDVHKGRSGGVEDFEVGDYPDLRDIGWNDRISGFRIPKGLKVVAYPHPDFGGTKDENGNWEALTLTGKDLSDGYEFTHGLGGGGDVVLPSGKTEWSGGNNTNGKSSKFYDTISSLRIQIDKQPAKDVKGSCSGFSKNSDKVFIFNKENYKGDCQSFGNGEHNIDEGRMLYDNATVRSVYMPSFRQVRLCTESGQGGECRTITKSQSSLTALYGQYKKSKSLRVRKN